MSDFRKWLDENAETIEREIAVNFGKYTAAQSATPRLSELEDRLTRIEGWMHPLRGDVESLNFQTEQVNEACGKKWDELEEALARAVRDIGLVSCRVDDNKAEIDENEMRAAAVIEAFAARLHTLEGETGVGTNQALRRRMEEVEGDVRGLGHRLSADAELWGVIRGLMQAREDHAERLDELSLAKEGLEPENDGRWRGRVADIEWCHGFIIGRIVPADASALTQCVILLDDGTWHWGKTHPDAVRVAVSKTIDAVITDRMVAAQFGHEVADGKAPVCGECGMAMQFDGGHDQTLDEPGEPPSWYCDGCGDTLPFGG